MTNNPEKKRTVKVRIGVFYATVSTGWNSAKLILSDSSGDVAPRQVTIDIERPSDLSYIRGWLDQIEEAWQKELDANKVRK
jgi:hypothetical protein